jgi:hypothetical protein
MMLTTATTLTAPSSTPLAALTAVTAPVSPILIRHRGRGVTQTDIDAIRALIAAHPGASRRRLSALLCEAWNWRQQNGCLRDMVCRGLMLELHRAGPIELPHKVKSPGNPLARRAPARPTPQAAAAADDLDRTPIECSLAELGPLRIEQVRRTQAEGLLRRLLERHHYLGFVRPVGEHLKFLVWAGERPIAALAFSSAPRHLAPRDRFIGWDAAARKRNLHLIASNTRFLIMPWLHVPHLASHLLGRLARQLPLDWQRLYGHPVHYLETFTDPELYAGTCYRAANWRPLGLTTGRGKADQTKKANRSLKLVWGLPLTARWRELLQGGA